VSKPVEENPFILEELVVPESTDAKVSPKSSQKAAHKKGERFIIITPEQAHKLSKAVRVTTVSVFFHLMFRGYRAGGYREPFTMPSDALDQAGISRHGQNRALRSLVKLGLISMERSGPKRPPIISLIGAKKRG
jgi:hypothetical protein